jgi:poly(beta-D-mannuronate) lyase
MKNTVPFIPSFTILFVFLALSFWSPGTTAQVTTEVKSTSELQKAVSVAKPGDVVILDDGIYSDVTIQISVKGTSTKPINIKAKNIGKVIFTVPVKSMENFFLLKELVFRNKEIWKFQERTAVLADVPGRM